MANLYFRAMATCSILKRQLEHEQQSHQAMQLCFQKIHKSLDRYKGHLVSRIRFHMNNHHTEYLRKVRLTQANKKKTAPATKPEPSRRSERISQMEDLSAQLEAMREELIRKNAIIDEMARMLDMADGHAAETTATKHDADTQTEDWWDGVFI